MRTRNVILAILLTAVTAASAGIWWGRQSATPVPAQTTGTPGAADIGFCQDMAVHHDQAVLMATLALDRAGPAVRALASSMLIDQSQEIGIMRGWLELWGQPMFGTQPMAWMHHDMAGMAGMSGTMQAMPGMASAQELNRLWAASGQSFDILFMQLMIRHHEGGIMMAKDAAQTARLDAVRNAARTMAIQQTLEASRMRQFLHADGASPLPAPDGTGNGPVS